MIKLRGFSLVELMVALGLSSFIMIGMVQSYRNATRLLKTTRNLLVVNRRVALLFNQIERDMTTAIVYRQPREYQKPTPKKGQKQSPPKSTREQRKKESPIPTFSLQVFDDASYKHREKKWQTTQMLNTISTTPLEVFGAEQERLVRVGYELTVDKNEDKSKQSYTLQRKQTHRLKNVSFKQDEESKEPIVASHIVAEKVKHFSIQATYTPKPEQKKGAQQSSEKKEPVKTFSWQDKEQRKSSTGLPEFINIHLELWDDDFEKTYSFECLVPCYVQEAWSVGKQEDKKEDEKNSDKKSEKNGQAESNVQLEGQSDVA